ncbi:hypothetical protein FRB97_003288 [Tulasnella sp. 331]|nr:hypothetical protein FRB97_003288 [Tulasnella sp. 331]
MKDVLRARRSVKYKDPEDMYPGTSALPVQWKSWLSHTRPNPPSLAELQADEARMTQLQANVLVIEERERQERARLVATSTPPQQLNAPLEGHVTSKKAEVGETRSRTELTEPHIPKRPLQPFAPTHASSSAQDEQPESWIPRMATRRGS